MKQLIKYGHGGLMLVIAFSFSPIAARNFYLPSAPLQTLHAAPVQNADKMFIHTYVSGYNRNAHAAFIDHGTKTSPLSTLYFNKSEFRLSQIFENCLVPMATKNYNPFMRITKLRPQVTYGEYGSTIGAVLETVVGKKQNLRIGLRAELPLKRREINRTDTGSRGPAEMHEVVRKNVASFTRRNGSGVATSATTVAAADTLAIRQDFLEALPTNTAYSESMVYSTSFGNTAIVSKVVNAGDTEIISAAYRVKTEGTPPQGDEVLSYDSAQGFDAHNAIKNNPPFNGVTAYLPLNLASITEENLYELQNGINYTSMLDSSTKTVAQRIADQDAKAKLWLIGTYDPATGTPNGDSQTIRETINDRLEGYFGNHYEWLADQGYSFQSQQCTGIGDLKLEAYTSFQFGETFSVTFNGGLLAPTASGSTAANDPYTIHLGNRGHTELFVGGGLSWQCQKYPLTFKANATYSRILPAQEKIAATPQGAQIKNMGPETLASIEWEQTAANAWVHFTHPHTTNVQCSLGYSLFVKTTDRITFVDDAIESWLGKKFNSTTRTFTLNNRLTLDSSVAAQHTQMIVHTVRSRICYNISEWVSLHTGASYVVAGKNTPQTLEFSGGCVIKF